MHPPIQQPQQQHHTLIISQDADEIFFSLSTYDDDYLGYLFTAGTARVISAVLLDAIPLLTVQEFGPFSIREKDGLRLVSQLVLALLIWQMEGYEASRLVASAVGTSSDDEHYDEDDGEDGDEDEDGSEQDEDEDGSEQEENKGLRSDEEFVPRTWRVPLI